ncbi:MAG TPA: helix-turn-helix transcriptional regulator [Bacteroidia bacterium]|nr:helix-turn-helix transcriptional regulator [Bacteroidia bacterium]HNG83448.1 helix-turn-helix transcriptional regulator [Bacteroidia bacterium]HNL35441.1 helix-turn-helix transcriptional regulator [Bacteroidia bacterium]HNO82218.1 helix-turn-helix transcriptional regulator [Bacteroidia bacterium]HRU18184.1 helix-turn-helix transcriptional regulator [Bacteroidia bacterium]
MYLTKREKEVINLLGRGLSDKSIALRLKISYNTVRTHRQNLRAKFKVTTTVAMIRMAIVMNMI